MNRGLDPAILKPSSPAARPKDMQELLPLQKASAMVFDMMGQCSLATHTEPAGLIFAGACLQAVIHDQKFLPRDHEIRSLKPQVYEDGSKIVFTRGLKQGLGVLCEY